LTSVAVALGAIGVWAGVPMADPVVGLGITLVILWLLASSTRTVVSRLMDGVEDGTLDGIRAVAAQVAGVEAVDRVRARWTGHRLEADLDVAVAADLDVAAGHRLAQEVHHALLHRVRHLEGATVHVHPPGVTAAHAPPPHHREAATRG
jgi:cation diffusion facilitator family transporter